MIKKKITTIFVDCFNTIIGRTKNPITVLLNFSKLMEEKYPNLKKIDFFVAYKYSIKQIQNRLIQESEEKEYRFKDVIEYIYKNFNLKEDLKITSEEFYQTAYINYYQSELKTLYLKRRTINFLKKRKKIGNSIYIVSDFYCGKETIKNWIIDVGLKEFDSIFNDVFVSCDFNRSKSTGNLYKHIITKLNLNFENVMMVGDNILPDIIKAKQSGIKKTKEVLPPKIRLIPLSYFKKKNSFKVPNEYKKLIRENKHFSFANLSFTFYSFIRNLMNECIEKQFKDIVFFARDGKFLKRLFDKYCELNNINLNTHYFYANRASVYLLTREGVSKKDFNELATKHFINIEGFLKSLGFNNEEINKIIEKCNIKQSKKRYFVLEKSKNYDKLINSKFFKEITDKRRITQRNNFIKYYLSLGINNDKFCFVDVGWNGRVQSYLSNIFNNKKELYGYYIGLTCSRPKETNMHKYGLAFSKTTHSYFLNSINKFRFLQYEQICRAGESRCIGYDNNGKAIFEKVDKEIAGFNKYVKAWQDNIYDSFIKINNIQKTLNCSYIDLLGSKMYLKTLKQSTFKTNYEYAKCQNSHFDSFARTGYNMRFASTIKTLYLLLVNKLFYLLNFNKINKRFF